MVLTVEVTVAIGISQRKLDVWRREWQKKLGLRDWRIKIQISPEDFIADITGTDACGAAEVFPEAKTARIHIATPRDDDTPRSQDVENTVIHELLHCHFKQFDDGNAVVQLQIEQIIEVISEALLNEKRGKSGK